MNLRHCARWFAYPLKSDLAEARLSQHSRYRNSNLLGAMAFGTKRPLSTVAVACHDIHLIGPGLEGDLRNERLARRKARLPSYLNLLNRLSFRHPP